MLQKTSQNSIHSCHRHFEINTRLKKLGATAVLAFIFMATEIYQMRGRSLTNIAHVMALLAIELQPQMQKQTQKQYA